MSANSHVIKSPHHRVLTQVLIFSGAFIAHEAGSLILFVNILLFNEGDRELALSKTKHKGLNVNFLFLN